jgi:hypothetical protein
MSLPTHFVFDPNDGMAFFGSQQHAESDAVARIACAMLDADGESREIIWGEICGISRLVPNESGGVSMRMVDPRSYPRRFDVLNADGSPIAYEQREEMRRKRGEL